MDADMSAADAQGTTLQMLLDERDIVALAGRYCRALDTKNWSQLSEVFLPDATAVLGAPNQLVGRDAITHRIRMALEYLDDSQHLVGNHEVTVDGNTGTHRCYLQAQHVREVPDGSPNYMIAGRYEDRVQRTPDGWRIAHRTLTVMWSEGNLAVVRP
jgi:ketosteroid isomerase-like protein